MTQQICDKPTQTINYPETEAVSVELFDDYQKQARTTAIYPNQGNNPVYVTLGLIGEAGEVAEKMKKVIRDNNGVIDAERKEELKKEIGDVMWYLANLCTELNLNFSEVAGANLQKLFSRKERGVIRGSGDNR
jgi:NTP pyrophosphatase (non-canonical NTP hydrolase)